jgi:hypothetical protein
MKMLEKLSLLSLIVVASAAFAACDVEDDDDDNGAGGAGGGAGGMGGMGGGAGGMGGGAGGGGGDVYDTIYILDTSAEENTAGTPGADICGVTANCGADDLTGDEADLTAGAGEVCNVGEPNCSADRDDPNAALDDGASCEAASNPSDYVAIGVDGSLAITFAQDLRGCSIEVIENNQGATPEGYDVFLCTDATATNCTTAEGTALHSQPNGGNAAFDIPAAE